MINIGTLRDKILKYGLDCVSDEDALELLDRLERAEIAVSEAYQKGYDTGQEESETVIRSMRKEIDEVKQVEFPKRVQKVADAWKSKCDRLDVEVATLRSQNNLLFESLKAAEFVRQGGDCRDWMAALKRNDLLLEERDALRAELKTTKAMLEVLAKQKPVAEWIENKFDQYPQLIWDEKYKAVVGTKLYALPGAQRE